MRQQWLVEAASLRSGNSAQGSTSPDVILLYAPFLPWRLPRHQEWHVLRSFTDACSKSAKEALTGCQSRSAVLSSPDLSCLRCPPGWFAD